MQAKMPARPGSGGIKMDRGSHWRWLGRASGRKCHPGGGHLRISDPPEV